jgi:hypothetical protein
MERFSTKVSKEQTIPQQLVIASTTFKTADNALKAQFQSVARAIAEGETSSNKPEASLAMQAARQQSGRNSAVGPRGVISGPPTSTVWPTIAMHTGEDTDAHNEACTQSVDAFIESERKQDSDLDAGGKDDAEKQTDAHSEACTQSVDAFIESEREQDGELTPDAGGEEGSSSLQRLYEAKGHTQKSLLVVSFSNVPRQTHDDNNSAANGRPRLHAPKQNAILEPNGRAHIDAKTQHQQDKAPSSLEM